MKCLLLGNLRFRQSTECKEVFVVFVVEKRGTGAGFSLNTTVFSCH
jgi:hypothetical protein